MFSALTIGNVVIAGLLFDKYTRRFNKKFESNGYKIDNKKAAFTPGSLLFLIPGVNILSSLAFDIYYLFNDDKFDKKLFKKLSKKGVLNKVNKPVKFNEHASGNGASDVLEFDNKNGNNNELGDAKTESKGDEVFENLSTQEKIELLKKERAILIDKTNDKNKTTSKSNDELDDMFTLDEEEADKGKGAK